MKKQYYEARIPYKLDADKSMTSMFICVESLDDGKGTYWSVQLDGNGVELLNHWLENGYYDNEVIKFPNYNRLLEFLTGLKEDIELAWENYNKEKEYAKTAFEEIKKLFQPVEYLKD